MKTLLPLILAARIQDDDLVPFDRLRRQHFPPDRNHIRAHLTMFHRLPGEYLADISHHVGAVTKAIGPITAEVSGIRHLGAGVAFTIASSDLEDVHSALKTAFNRWLGPQDIQKWQPHITVQNKVSKAVADDLFSVLSEAFCARPIRLSGVDLWRYLGGPWQHQDSFHFTATERPDPVPKDLVPGRGSVNQG